MDPTEDAFLALARSSPWRWTTLHFSHRWARGGVEAWLRRPGQLLVRMDDGTEHRVQELPHSRRTTTVWLTRPGPDQELAAPVEPPAPRLPHEVSPELRPDGLVAVRPGRRDVEYDDPMWQSYSWVAMLDPVELSHHVDVADLRAGEVAGRPVWRATLRALPGYEPRCGGNCCELLYSEAGLRADFPRPEDVPEGWGGRTYPDAYDVALDVRTGVVVRCLPLGGEDGAPWLEIDIHDVDADLDHLFPSA